MTDIAKALEHGWSGAEWSLDGDSYQGLTWIGPGPKPTQAEIAAKWGEYAAARDDIEAARRLDINPVLQAATLELLGLVNEARTAAGLGTVPPAAFRAAVIARITASSRAMPRGEARSDDIARLVPALLELLRAPGQSDAQLRTALKANMASRPQAKAPAP